MTKTAKRGLLTVAILTALLCSSTGSVQAQAHDPTTVLWDVNISGAVRGLAQIAFVFDNPPFGGTVAGFIIVRPTRNIKPANVPSPLVFGSSPLSGNWSFDIKGGLIGFLSGGTSALPFDMSFTGKVTTGASLSLTAKGDGTWKMKGVPSIPDNGAFDGTTWNAQVSKDQNKFIELFVLTSDICPDDPPPVDPDDCVGARFTADNLYELYGGGPGYLTQGYVMVGDGGRIALVLKEHEINKTTGIPATGGIVRAVSGTYKLGKTSSMIGTDHDHLVTMSAFSPDLLP